MGEWPLNRPWRLIVSPEADGPWNMALDEALAGSVREGGLPFLRFYRWAPGTLSLGRFQNQTTGLTDQSRMVPRVRRLTGGGGIWHENELTYSLGCRQDDLGIIGVKPSFELLCGFLLDTWKTLGWDARFAKDSTGIPGALGAFTPACFAGQEEYDILVNGKKLGGNAQRRDRETIFQHGSIPQILDRNILDRLFLPGFRPNPDHTTDLGNCGWKEPLQELIFLLTRSFGNRLETGFEESRPTADEVHRARELVSIRYGTPDWTENGGGNLRNA